MEVIGAWVVSAFLRVVSVVFCSLRQGAKGEAMMAKAVAGGRRLKTVVGARA